MVRFVFSVEDLASTRFAISPMWELVRSLVALRDPSHAALHVPWLRSLSGRLDGLALEPAVALTSPRGFTPDFLTPPPSGPLGSIADDLAALRATGAAQIRADKRLFASQHPRGGATAAPWLAHPRAEVRRLADVLEAYWTRAVEPAWPRVRSFLDADIAYRSRRLAAGGPAALFADLCEGVSWAQPHLDVRVPVHEATIELGGRGLLLMPSAFSATRPFVIDRSPWQPTVIYPARGIATLWEDAPPAPSGSCASWAPRAPRSSPTSPRRARPPSSPSACRSAPPGRRITSPRCATPGSSRRGGRGASSSTCARRWATP